MVKVWYVLKWSILRKLVDLIAIPVAAYGTECEAIGQQGWSLDFGGVACYNVL